MSRSILVTGDVVLDRQVYVGSESMGTRMIDSGGGAWLLHKLLQSIAEQTQSTKPTIHLGIEPPDVKQLQDHPGMHCFASYRPLKATVTAEKKTPKVWRSADALGYGKVDKSTADKDETGKDRLIRASKHLQESHDLWVIDDANRGFREVKQRSLWPQSSASEIRPWVVLKMCCPHAKGDLWRTVIGSDAESFGLADQLVAVVSIHDLREEGAFVSRGMSWERALSEVAQWVKNVEAQQTLINLRQARYLVVSFGPEGAVVVDTQEQHLELIYDIQHVEGEWIEQYPGRVFGLQSVLTAAVALALHQFIASSNEKAGAYAVICQGVRAGLAGMRDLIAGGHGDESLTTPEWPFERVAKVVAKRLASDGGDATMGKFSGSLSAPWFANPNSMWRIIDHSETQSGVPVSSAARVSPFFGLARMVAQFGLKAASAHVPRLSIGDLVSVDRQEIESLRTIKQLVQNYERERQKRPLCIGVFGQPGCGKSFGVKQVAMAFLSKDVPILEFNLSQFKSTDDLIAAFHQIRDKVLQGTTPVVFWDEFDSEKNVWLKPLLAPMQDGKFRDGPLEHTLGKCVFVFAGGTSYDFASFGPPEKWDDVEAMQKKYPQDLKDRFKAEQLDFVAKKGPDFKSRLDGFLDVAGPNRRQKHDWASQQWRPDESDVGYPIRRALLLRSLLGLKDADEHHKADQMRIDANLLNALLLIDYRHGARSMEKIVEQMKARSGGGKLMRAQLPPQEVLGLHVCVSDLEAVLDACQEYLRKVQQAAPLLHQNYLEGVYAYQKALKAQAAEFRKAQKEVEAASLEFDADNAISTDLDVAYEKLKPTDQESNIAQAQRIPRLLACVRLTIVPIDSQILEHQLTEDVELLSELEHILWMEDKVRDGWRYGTRDNPDVQARDNPQTQPISQTEQFKAREKIRKSLKLHACLLPYAQLPEYEKDKDRNLIKNLPSILKKLGFKIVAIRSGTDSTGSGHKTSVTSSSE